MLRKVASWKIELFRQNLLRKIADANLADPFGVVRKAREAMNNWPIKQNVRNNPHTPGNVAWRAKKADAIKRVKMNRMRNGTWDPNDEKLYFESNVGVPPEYQNKR